MGRLVSIAQACGMHGVDAEALVRDLRAAMPSAGRRDLPLRVAS